MTATSSSLSARTRSAVELVLPSIKTTLHNRDNNNCLDLAVAENYLIRDELVELYKEIIQGQLGPEHLSYPRGFGGDPELLNALAGFFNQYFNPHVPVTPAHVVAGPGATYCLIAFLFSICEEGDAVIVPGSYWNGFDFHLSLLPGATIVNSPVSHDPGEETDEHHLMQSLRASVEACGSKRPRALILTNPHNPTGRCYTRAALISAAQFCEAHGLHLILDEVYGLSLFQWPVQEAAFVSVLALDLSSLGVNAGRIHVLWSSSKDFGSSGFRMGCLVSQANSAVCTSIGMLTTTQISTLASCVTSGLLQHPRLPQLIALNQERLTTAYIKVTWWLNKYNIKFVEAAGGVYVLARLAPQAETWVEEADTMAKLKTAGVLVTAGRSVHLPEDCKGWFRIIIAVEPSILDEALRRMTEALGLGQPFANS